MSGDGVIGLIKEGLAHHQQGALDEAETLYRQALEQDASNTDAIHFLGLIYQARGELSRAEDHLAQACGMRPEVFNYHFNYARFLEETGRLEEAQERYRVALTLKPDFALAHNNLGTVLKNLDRDREAEAAFREALQWEPRLAMAWNNLGNVLKDLGDRDEALAAFAQAQANDPALIQAHQNRLRLLKEMGRPEAALEEANRAEAHFGGEAWFHSLRGALLREVGQLQEAAEEIRTALRIDPDFAPGYANLVPLVAKREGAGFPELDTMMKLYRDPGLGNSDRADLAFGLGDYFDLVGEPQKAFPSWLEANHLVRREKEVHEEQTFQQMEAWKDAFPASVWQDFDTAGYPSETPVFVVGMPRSGTTLVEQILSSHSKVAGAGEAGLVPDLIREEIERQEGNVDPEKWDEWLTPEKAYRMGELYTRKMEALAPGAERIVNKSPGNFRIVGLIRAILPNARIIHCQRHPLDTCLSIFSKNFAASVNYSFDLEETGRHYRLYERLMAHWRQTLPQGSLLDLGYEELVADPEVRVQGLLEYCGLEWEDDCLRFFETRRPVATASQTQVRRPIYQSSVGRWQAYSRYLRPLAAAMGREELLGGAGEFQGFSEVAANQLGHGSYVEAEENLQRALSWEEDRPEIRYELGRALEGQLRFAEAAGEYERAFRAGRMEAVGGQLRALRKAGRQDELASELAHLPQDVAERPAIQVEKGFSALEGGALAEAEHLFGAAITADPDSAEAWLGLARVAAAAGRADEAFDQLRGFRDRLEGEPEPGLALVGFLLDQGRSEEAAAEGWRLLGLTPRSAAARLLLAQALLETDRPEEAEQVLRAAVELFPRTGILFSQLGRALLAQGRTEEAEPCLDWALELGPRTPEALFWKAKAFVYQERPTAALPLLEEGLRWDPGAENLILARTTLLENLNRLEEAEQILETEWGRIGHHPQARYLGARLARRRGHVEGGLALLRDLAEHEPERLRPEHWAELGQLYDRAGDTEAAFAAFSRAQEDEAARRVWSRVPKEAYWDKLDRLRTNFEEGWLESWASLPDPAPSRRTPVFLVGFPRSGTTLTEHTLRAHPQVEVVEERETVEPLANWLEERYGGDLAGLRDLTEADREYLRDLYWETVAEYLENPEVPVVVDKMPLRCTDAGMIHRLFPEARFVFLRRHPCDCVLSAFCQVFTPNQAMASFLRLEDAAVLYDKVMGLWEQYRRLFPLKVHEVHYERLVEEFEPTIAGILDFLGLEWDPRVTERRQGGSVGRVRTPSYTQVSQPIYSDASYRWQRYRSHLEPVLETLLPHIRSAGYPE